MAHPSIDPARFLHDHLTAASPGLLRSLLTTFIDTLMSAEADAMCGAEYGTSSPERVNTRNGYRHRDFDTRAGTLDVAIPKLRQGSSMQIFEEGGDGVVGNETGQSHWRLAVRVHHERIRPMLSQQCDHRPLVAGVEYGREQWRVAVPVHRVHLGASLQQPCRSLGGMRLGRQMQRPEALRIPGIRVGAGRQVPPDRSDVVLQRRVVQGTPARPVNH